VEKQRAKKSKEFEGSAKPPTFRPPHFSEWLHVIGSLSDRLTVNFSIPHRQDEYIISCYSRAKKQKLAATAITLEKVYSRPSVFHAFHAL
jgi:hypothetical protein